MGISWGELLELPLVCLSCGSNNIKNDKCQDCSADEGVMHDERHYKAEIKKTSGDYET